MQGKGRVQKYKLTVNRQLMANNPVSINMLCYVLNNIVLDNVCLCLSPFSFARTGCAWLEICQANKC